jgi:hypothetical protein
VCVRVCVCVCVCVCLCFLAFCFVQQSIFLPLVPSRKPSKTPSQCGGESLSVESFIMSNVTTPHSVVVAIFDTGTDPGAPGLSITTTGERKVVDVVRANIPFHHTHNTPSTLFATPSLLPSLPPPPPHTHTPSSAPSPRWQVDASGSGDVDTSMVRKPDAQNRVLGLSGRLLTLPAHWATPPSGVYHVGLKRAFDLYPKPLTTRIKAERKEAHEQQQRRREGLLQQALAQLGPKVLLLNAANFLCDS